MLEIQWNPKNVIVHKREKYLIRESMKKRRRKIAIIEISFIFQLSITTATKKEKNSIQLVSFYYNTHKI